MCLRSFNWLTFSIRVNVSVNTTAAAAAAAAAGESYWLPSRTIALEELQ